MKIGFAGALCLILIVLKLIHVITTPWIWVLSPLWIGGFMWLIIVFAIVLVAALLGRRKPMVARRVVSR